jgi:hypothetical protein
MSPDWCSANLIVGWEATPGESIRAYTRRKETLL